MLFTVTDFLDTDYVALLEGASGLDALEETVVLRGATRAGPTSWDDFVARADQVDTAAVRDRAASIGGDDLSDILFTSGTTGNPKGAMLRHAAGIKAFDAWATVVGLREGDRYLIINPFFHAFGLKAGILACAHQGGDDPAAAGLRRPHGHGAGAPGPHHDAARAAGRVPDDPQPPGPRALRHDLVAAGRHRRRPDPGRDWSTA